MTKGCILRTEKKTRSRSPYLPPLNTHNPSVSAMDGARVNSGGEGLGGGVKGDHIRRIVLYCYLMSVS